jgi:hypothetical protein
MSTLLSNMGLLSVSCVTLSKIFKLFETRIGDNSNTYLLVVVGEIIPDTAYEVCKGKHTGRKMHKKC